MIDLTKKNTLNGLMEVEGSLRPSTSSLDSEEWYTSFWSVGDDLLKRRYGCYEILDVLFSNDKMNDDVYLTRYATWAREQIRSVLEGNSYKYKGLYESTQFEYNPLFNVDGTETIERERHNTGTQGTVGSSTSSNDVQSGRTTFDSSASYDTDKVESLGEGATDSTRTDNLTETEVITNTRKGNIGVTKTTELIKDQRDVLLFDFADIVIKDFLPQIAYMVYTL